MSELIKQRGHAVTLIPPCSHTEAADADFSQQLMFAAPFDWVVVDHYALGKAWEDKIPPATKVMV
ncbi:MAG: hypothetical protein AAF745_17875, partial [Planctomycetota bacterium]